MQQRKMCDKMVTSWDMKITSHCALHLRARAEHMHNTNAHTTKHNPCGIASLRSSTIYTYIYIYIFYTYIILDVESGQKNNARSSMVGLF